jgi:putative oxidoreductase
MSFMHKTLSSIEPYALALLRVIVGFNFVLHGVAKMGGAFGGVDGKGGIATAFSLFWFAGVLEIVGGPLIMFGLFTRPVAFLLSGEMAVAYFMAHAPNSFWPLVNGGEITVLNCFVFLYLVTSGPGALSLDNRKLRF